MDTTDILLVDAHALVRAGLCVLLERISGVKVVAETGDGREVLSLAALHQPQIVLLDDGLPEVNAFEIVVQLLANHPNVRVVILSAQDSEEGAAEAFRAGAIGYLHKSAPPEELVRALEAVRKGEEYPASKPSSSSFIRGRAPAGNQARPASELTPRQQQVLKLIAEGYSTREIAHSMEISVKTVESHRTHLMDRLNIHDIASLVRYAIRMGVVEIEGYDGAAEHRASSRAG